jgi:hypothetical protein
MDTSSSSTVGTSNSGAGAFATGSALTIAAGGSVSAAPPTGRGPVTDYCLSPFLYTLGIQIMAFFRRAVYVYPEDNRRTFGAGGVIFKEIQG